MSASSGVCEATVERASSYEARNEAFQTRSQWVVSTSLASSGLLPKQEQGEGASCSGAAMSGMNFGGGDFPALLLEGQGRLEHILTSMSTEQQTVAASMQQLCQQLADLAAELRGQEGARLCKPPVGFVAAHSTGAIEPAGALRRNVSLEEEKAGDGAPSPGSYARKHTDHSDMGGFEIDRTATQFSHDWPTCLKIRHRILDTAPPTPTKDCFTISPAGSVMMPASSANLAARERSHRWSCGGESGCKLKPNGPVRSVHDLLSLVILLTDLLTTPYALAWNVPFVGTYKKLCFFSGFFWAVDIFLNFVTAYYEQGELITDYRKIFRRYFRSWFILDVLAVGVDWMSMVVMQGGKSWKLLRFAKLGRLLRILTMVRLLRHVQIAEQIFEEFMTANISEGARVWMTFVGLVSFVLGLSHLATCLFWALGQSALTDTGLTWLSAPRDIDQHGALYQYMTAYHWAIAQLTLGSMEVTCKNSIERIFNVVCLVMGLLLGCTLISSVSATLVGFQAARKETTQQRRRLQRFMRENSIPVDVAHPIQQQATERLRVKKKVLFEDVEAVALLSAPLRSRLCFEIFRQKLIQHPLFRFWHETSTTTLQRFCAASVETMLLSCDDELFVARPERIQNVYFLAEGTITYSQEPGSSVVESNTERTVDKGQWLSEAAFWTQWHHVGTAQASALCSVLRMQGDGLGEVLRKRGGIGHITRQYGREYFQCVVNAKPPEAQWPDDLAVPLTAFEDIVMSMDLDTQKALSTHALRHYGSKHGNMGYFSSHRQKLEKEVSAGKCIVTVDAHGLLQRAVRVCALRLQHGTGEACLVQLGKKEKSRYSANVQLPGAKLQPGEAPKDAVTRLMGSKLQPLGIDANTVNTDYEVRWQDSKEYGLRTKYLRTVMDMSLHSMNENQVCRIHPALFEKLQQSAQHSLHVLPDVSMVSFLEKQVYFACDEDSNLTFYSWLQSHEVDYLNGPGEGFLTEWVASLVPISRWSAKGDIILDMAALQALQGDSESSGEDSGG